MSIDIGSRVPTLIIGESGCGKSTLAKLICGLYAPDKGHVEANGRSLADHDPHSVRRAIAYRRSRRYFPGQSLTTYCL